MTGKAGWPECEFDLDHITVERQQELDKKLLSHLKEVEAVIERLLETNEILFEVKEIQGRSREAVSYSLTGKRFKILLEKGCEEKCATQDVVNHHPYVRAFHSVVEELNDIDLEGIDSYEKAAQLNAAVALIRGTLNGKPMKEYQRKLQKAKEKRKKGAAEYLKSLRDKYSKILVLRVDLSYRHGKYVDLDDFSSALTEVKADWARFREDIANGIPISGVVGFIAKLEYGVLKGFHFHTVIICNGAKHREDISLARMVGEHWNNNIVNDCEGRYFNCNLDKNKYRYLGIGTLEYYDHAKYSALLNLVVEYMVKIDYIMAAQAPGKRVWFRGVDNPPELDNRRGRPRKFRGLD